MNVRAYAIAILMMIVIGTHAPATHAASDTNNWQPVADEFVTLVKQIWNRITAAARVLDQWMEDRLHISFSKIVRFIANIIIWTLEWIINIIKWIVGAIT